MLVGITLIIAERMDDPDPLVIDTEDVQQGDIRVYVAGAVERPGVYPLQSGDRWIDALEAAGGATADADLTRVNLARRAADEDQVMVPEVGQTVVAGAVDPIDAGLLVNINSAGEDELQALPGIGEVRSERIIQSRTVDGPFLQIEDLVLRELIPESVFEEIAPMITVAD